VTRIAIALLLLVTGCRAVHQPTVVFESGLGDDSAPWWRSGVASRVQAVAPVFTYDRAKDPRTPRTAKNIARELHERLAEAHVAPPYVLVSHSFGAEYVLQFASDYRDEVVGLVMVDPTPFRFFTDGFNVLSPADRAALEEKMRNYAAQAGPRRRAEWEAKSGAAAEAERAQIARDMPVTIISATGHSPDKPEAIREWWIAQHEAWAKRYPAGRLVQVDCGHYVQLEKPDVVVAEIVRTLDSLRSRSQASGVR
jgi:pimeloyl-ACP methyl ester carboxylesterase